MKFIPAIMALLISVNALAALKGAPFIPEEDQRFNALENQTAASAAISRLYAKAIYDVSIQGGQSVAHPLGVVLPAGAILESVVLYIDTAFTQTGAGSVALQCEGVNDITDWQDLTVAPVNSYTKRSLIGSNFGSNGSVVASGAAWTSVNSGASIASACTINAVVRSLPIPGGNTNGGNPQLTGRMSAVIDYFMP